MGFVTEGGDGNNGLTAGTGKNSTVSKPGKYGAEQTDCSANGQSAQAFGSGTISSGYAAAAEGYQTRAEGMAAHAEGMQTRASQPGAHAEGFATAAVAPFAHAGGMNAIARSIASRVLGGGSFSLYKNGEAQYVERAMLAYLGVGKKGVLLQTNSQGDGRSNTEFWQTNRETVVWLKVRALCTTEAYPEGIPDVYGSSHRDARYATWETTVLLMQGPRTTPVLFVDGRPSSGVITPSFVSDTTAFAPVIRVNKGTTPFAFSFSLEDSAQEASKQQNSNWRLAAYIDALEMDMTNPVRNKV